MKLNDRLIAKLGLGEYLRESAKRSDGPVRRGDGTYLPSRASWQGSDSLCEEHFLLSQLQFRRFEKVVFDQPQKLTIVVEQTDGEPTYLPHDQVAPFRDAIWAQLQHSGLGRFATDWSQVGRYSVEFTSSDAARAYQSIKPILESHRHLNITHVIRRFGDLGAREEDDWV